MGDSQNGATIDMIRWTFAVNSEHRAEVEEHLEDLGLDVLVRDDTHFVVTWEEPEGSLDELIETIWAINEEPFEITQEEFHRQNLVHYHYEETGESVSSDRAVA